MGPPKNLRAQHAVPTLNSSSNSRETHRKTTKGTNYKNRLPMYLYNNSERNPTFSHVMLHPVEKL